MSLCFRFVTAVRIRRLRRISRTRPAGFTLLEMMIVLALIGLIASAVGVSLYRRYRDGQRRVAQIQIQQLHGTVHEYMIFHPACPTLDDLVTTKVIPRTPHDPWGTSILLRCPGQHDPDPIDIVSWDP